MNPKLSIIIPAYNEERRIESTLDAVVAYVSRQPYACEILVVNDGSGDTTAEIVEVYASSNPSLSLIPLPRNRGKGAAVKAGMLAARGDLRLFMDADNSTSIEELDELLPSMGEGCDVVIGSRRMPGSVIAVPQSATREILGSAFRLLARMLVPTGVRDTQNGFKLFSASAATTLFSRLKTEGWSFDVELLLAARRWGYRVKEVPIAWRNDDRSRMRLRQMSRMLLDLIRISWTSN